MRRSLVLSALVALVAPVMALVVSPPSALAAECAPLDASALQYGSPHLAGTVNFESAPEACYSLTEPAGTVLYLGNLRREVNAEVLDSAGQRICDVRGQDCTLATDAQILRVWPASSGDVPYEIQAFRLAADSGCAPKATASFGDPREAVASAELRYAEAGCFGYTLTAGRHRVTARVGTETPWTLYDSAGVPICSSAGAASCNVTQTGQHLLVATKKGDYWDKSTFAGTVVDLSSNAGCAAPVETTWSANPPITVTPATDLDVACYPLVTDADDVLRLGTYYERRAEVVGPNGEVACDQVAEKLGCDLSGAGPYRLLVSGGGAQDHQVGIRNVGPDSDCPTIAPTGYGVAAADNHPGVGCRRFDVAAGDQLLINPTRDGWREPAYELYDADGNQLCASSEDRTCAFPSATRVTMITGVFDITHVTSLHRLTESAGCSSQSMDLLARKGSLGEGQVDCSTLAANPGDALILAQPRTPGRAAHVRVVNGAGVTQCQESSWRLDCNLTGSGPFRALVSQESDYQLAVVRRGDTQRCSPLGRSTFGATTAATQVSLDADHFARCFVVPAANRDQASLFSFARKTGTTTGSLAILDQNSYCTTQALDRIVLECNPQPANAAYTVFVANDGTSSSYSLRRYSTASHSGCQSARSTKLGGPATGVGITDRSVLHCISFAGMADDRFWVDVRDSGNHAKARILNAENATACQTDYYGGCLVDGSTAYRVIANSDRASSVSVDMWRVRSRDGYAPECIRYADYSRTFGPTSATLSTSKTALCLVLKGSSTSYEVDVTNTENGSAVPVPRILKDDITHYPHASSCDGGNPWICRHFTSHPSETGLLLLPLPDGASRLPFRVAGRCVDGNACSGVAVTSHSPVGATEKTRARVTIRGERFQPWSNVRLERSDWFSIDGTNIEVSAGGTVMTVEFDLENAKVGEWSLTVDGRGGPAISPTPFVITAQGAIVPVTAPTITGSPRVDGVLKASTGQWTPTPTSYSYRWYVNGAPISGATASSYTIPGRYLGRSISVAVTAKRSDSLATRFTSASKKVALGSAPVVVKKPTVTGTRRVGSRVTATKGTWSKTPSSYTYQWYVSGKKVAGATRSSLLLMKGMRGKQVKVVVTARRTGCANGTAPSQPFTVR